MTPLFREIVSNADVRVIAESYVNSSVVRRPTAALSNLPLLTIRQVSIPAD